MPRRTDADPRFPARLKALRTERGMTHKALAKAAAVGSSYLSELENGLKNPGTEVAAALDRALKADGELIGMVAERGTRGRRSGRAGGVSASIPLPLQPAASEAFAAVSQASKPGASLPELSRLDVEEILAHLREQWHMLVRTDNLLGPRHALTGVRDQVAILTEIVQVLGGDLRAEAVRLAAQFAESAGWLHEDMDELVQAQLWTSQSMEWAYEADDATMLAWTAFRRSQQATATGDTQRAIALAQAVQRKGAYLADPIKAAARVQEARGHALTGDGGSAMRLLDDAHCWAADDSLGDARAGHGSFCTAGYIEVYRAECLARLRQPAPAIACYERAIPLLPTVYRRDRAAALAGKATVHAAAGQAEEAAATAHEALPVARRAGSRRIVRQLAVVGDRLAQYRELPPVADLLDDLRVEAA